MKEKVICGIDFSVNSPGVVWVKTDEQFNVIDRKWITFTNKKKYVSDDPRATIEYIGTVKDKRTFNNNIDQNIGVRDSIWEWIINATDKLSIMPSGFELTCLSLFDYCVFEDYALAAKGRVFHIAEATMTMKLKIFENNIPIRLYPPNHIKLFATGHGNADKFEMENAFEALSEEERRGMDLTCIPTLKEQKNGNPRDNIIDAFWASELLRTELKLRFGLIALYDLPEHQIKVFNLTTKSYPTNILAREFLQKGKMYE